jgi:hypothetical protein
VAQGSPRGEERPVEVDGQKLTPFRELELLDRRDRLYAGIGDDDIDAAE